MNRLTHVRAAAAATLVLALGPSLCGSPVSAAGSGLDAVPCDVYGYSANSRCPNPFVEGVVDGQWIGLVMNWSGGNGGVIDMLVFTIGRGGNGFLTKSIGKVEGIDNGHADQMSALFHNGKLWVINPFHLPGEAHFGATHKVVQQFGFHDRQLKREATVTVPLAASDVDIDAALRRAKSN